jgi:hypothetical protein
VMFVFLEKPQRKKILTKNHLTSISKSKVLGFHFYVFQSNLLQGITILNSNDSSLDRLINWCYYI